MPFPAPAPRRLVLAAAAAVVIALSGCSASPGPAGTADTHTTSGEPPGSHAHGLAVDARTGELFLATHEGLFNVTGFPGARIGTPNDFMGFTPAAEPGVFYASGHPGPDSTLPNPMGLLRSSDGGKTWEPLSRQGESDFHALTTSKSGVLGFDGTLRASADGTTWSAADPGFTPFALAGHPAADTVLATTTDGLRRSTDGGKTWTLNTAAPVIQFAAFASATDVVGIAPGGKVHTSADAGATWAPAGQIEGTVQALTALKAGGPAAVWAATAEGIVHSSDGGATFSRYGGN
ncbi:F510_1955 family glycosylhydrolase [Arthrobacter sp. AD-310]